MLLLRYVGRRLLTIIPIFLIATMVVFALQTLVPGTLAVVLAGPGGTKAQIAQFAQLLHLNQPLPERYWHWLVGVLHGTLGTSVTSHIPVSSLIASAWPVTASVVFGSLFLAVLVAPVVACLGASRPGSVFDTLTTVASSAAVAIPDFVLGLFLIVVFAIDLAWFPIQGYVAPTTDFGQWLYHLFLPCLCLAVPIGAGLARQLRYGLAEVLEQDYVRTAYAKGLRKWTVLLRHALPAASPSAVGLLGFYMARLLGGAVVIEYVFGLPGLGQLTITAILNRNFDIIQGTVLVFIAAALLSNLLADIVVLALRPRLRTGTALSGA